MKKMTIGQLAKNTGIKVGTILYYEKRGLLNKPPRLASGYRIYSDVYVERITFIKNAKNLGFTLGEIIELTQIANLKNNSNEFKRFVEEIICKTEDYIQKRKNGNDALKKLAKECTKDSKKINMSWDCIFTNALSR